MRFIDKFSVYKSKRLFYYSLIIPVIIIILLVLIYPLVHSFYISFFDLTLYKAAEAKFVGLKNYIDIMKSVSFWKSMGRTAYFVLGTVIVEIILGLAIALVLNQKFIGRTVVRGLVLLPWALPGVVNGVMWKWIYNANYGALNALLSQLHIIDSYQIWLKDPFVALNLIMAANIWKETPVAVIIILASLQTIPSELYEVADIDGANPFSKFRWVTLPLITPVVATTFIIKAIWAVREFDLIYMITRGGPQEGTTIINYFIYLQSFKFLKFSYGSAIAYMVTILVIVLAVVFVRRTVMQSVRE